MADPINETLQHEPVGRTVIRETLCQPEAEGLIKVVANKSAVMRNLSFAAAMDLYAIRAVLKGLATRQFAERTDEARRAELTIALAKTAKTYGADEPVAIVEAKK